MNVLKDGDAVLTPAGIGRILRKWDDRGNWLVLHVPERGTERGLVRWYDACNVTKLVPERTDIRIAREFMEEALRGVVDGVARAAARALIERHVCPDHSKMGKHACANRQQCWEPCGELGKSEKHAKPSARENDTGWSMDYGGGPAPPKQLHPCRNRHCECPVGQCSVVGFVDARGTA